MKKVDITVFERGRAVGGRLVAHGNVYPFDDRRLVRVSAGEIAGASLLSFLGSENMEKRSGEVGL
jgi:hypothetical protein